MAFDAMLRVIKQDLADDLVAEVEKKGTFLQKMATRIYGDGPELSEVLQAALFVNEKDPNKGKMLLDLLEQFSSQALQNALNKMMAEGEDVTANEVGRIEHMADLLRARARLGREQMELLKVQKDVAQEMGLTGTNPAMAAMAQTPFMGGAPPAGPPMPQLPPMGAPPMGMPSMGAPPMGAPPAPPMGGPAGPPPPAAPSLPGSPMEAAAL